MRDYPWWKRLETWRNNRIPRHNVPCHTSLTAKHFLLKDQIPTIPQPLYSPDLAPCDLFPRLQTELNGTHYDCRKIQQNATAGLTALPKDLKKEMLPGIAQLLEQVGMWRSAVL
jgi:hypothetical protein